MNNISAVALYKDMSAGTAQINPLSDFLQENEKNMKENPHLFVGEGYNLGSGLPLYDFEAKDVFDYSKPGNFDYSKQQTYETEKRLTPYLPKCGTNEDSETCLKRIFECDPNKSWKECDDQIETCSDDPTGQSVCKYDMNRKLIKKFDL